MAERGLLRIGLALNIPHLNVYKKNKDKNNTRPCVGETGGCAFGEQARKKLTKRKRLQEQWKPGATRSDQQVSGQLRGEAALGSPSAAL